MDDPREDEFGPLDIDAAVGDDVGDDEAEGDSKEDKLEEEEGHTW